MRTFFLYAQDEKAKKEYTVSVLHCLEYCVVSCRVVYTYMCSMALEQKGRREEKSFFVKSIYPSISVSRL